MIERDETVYVRHMLDAIDRIAQYVEGQDESAFWASELLQDGIIRQLEILGEAAGRVSKETCAAHPAVPWPKITGLRRERSLADARLRQQNSDPLDLAMRECDP